MAETLVALHSELRGPMGGGGPASVAVGPSCSPAALRGAGPDGWAPGPRLAALREARDRLEAARGRGGHRGARETIDADGAVVAVRAAGGDASDSDSDSDLDGDDAMAGSGDEDMDRSGRRGGRGKSAPMIDEDGFETVVRRKGRR